MKSDYVTPYSKGIDTVMRLSQIQCAALVELGYDFVIRYLYGRYALKGPELETILNSGLGLMTCVPSRSPGWVPTLELGESDASETLQALGVLGLPPHTVSLDLEGTPGPADATCEWIDVWSKSVKQNGFEAGLYVGANPGGMDSQLLWERPHITKYWRSGSRVPEPANRGWCMQQLRPLDTWLAMPGRSLRVDVDVVERDFKGSVPTCVRM